MLTRKPTKKEQTKKGFIKYFKRQIDTFFYNSYSRRALIEVLFLVAIAVLFSFKYYWDFNIKEWVFLFFISWSVLALLGFFIPTVKENFVIGLQGPTSHGIPMSIQSEARGGFIAGRKIYIKIKILDITKGINSKQQFRDYYDEFSVVYFQSIQLPIDKGKYLEGNPSAGGINIEMKKCKGKGSILFNSPGLYSLRILYKKKDDPKSYSDFIKSENVEKKIIVSPAENYISLRNYAITYSLTLIILSLALLQSGLI